MSRKARIKTQARSVVAAIAVAGVVLVGCGTEKAATEHSESPVPAPEVSTSSPSPSGEMPSPSPPAVPTVADLEAHLGGVLNAWGAVECDGSGQIGEGVALTCRAAVGERPGVQQSTYLVAVLDEDGRYTFTDVGWPHADAADYPARTISCRTLLEPPSSSEKPLGLDYTAVMHYWMAMGSPDSMDDDRNGLPCETVYPPATVARVAASPLKPLVEADSRVVTLDDVRAHAEVVASTTGQWVQGSLGEAVTYRGLTEQYPEVRCAGGSAPVKRGDTLDCVYDMDFDAEGLMQASPLVRISVVDEDGSYLLAFGGCCGEPNLEDYPASSSCADYAQAPPTWSSDGYGMDYSSLVFQWMSEGMPGSWDQDGDGWPCEDFWTPIEISRALQAVHRM